MAPSFLVKNVGWVVLHLPSEVMLGWVECHEKLSLVIPDEVVQCTLEENEHPVKKEVTLTLASALFRNI